MGARKTTAKKTSRKASTKRKPATKKAPAAPSVQGLSIVAYAKHRRELGLPGGNKNAVSKALETGRISRNRYGRIDPVQADKDWSAFTDPALAPRANGHGDPGTMPYALARARKEAAEAELKELDLAERRRELVSVQEVRRKTFALFRVVRERVLAVPGRISSDLLGAETVKELELRLRGELRSALEDAASFDAAELELEQEKVDG